MSDLVLDRFTPWSIPDDGMVVLERLVQEHRPGLVLELGSGRSTVQLASYLAAAGFGRLVSLDHLRKFSRQAETQLEVNGLEGAVQTRWAPLADHGQPDCLAPSWYAASGWSDLEGISMLVVDGPPGAVVRCARDPAVPLLLPRLDAGCVLVLDDTNRTDERMTLDHWQELIPDLRWRHCPHSIGQLSWAVCP